MSIKTLLEIKDLLDSKNISFRHITHDTIGRDSLSASKTRGTDISRGAKALVLETKDKKIFQVVISADLRLDLKKVKTVLGQKNVSLAHPDNVFALSDCVVGSVPPFGILWNIDVFVDESILKKEEVVFSAGTLEDSIFIKPQDLVSCNNAVVVDVSKKD